MKITPVLLMVAMLLSGVLVMAPVHASAATGPSTVTTNNVYGNQQGSFTVDGALFFAVNLNTTGAQSVNVAIINTTSGSTLTSKIVTTASNGVYQSWVLSNFNFFDLSYYATGSYKLQLSVGGTAVANASFIIAYPVYTASVHTTLSSYVKPNNYFLVYSQIYVSVLTTDQFGNPMSGNTSAFLNEFLYGGAYNTDQNVLLTTYMVPNDYGIATTSFYSGSIGYLAGGYNLTVRFNGYPAGSSSHSPAIGKSTYYLISPTLSINPYKPGNVYGQGTTLNFQGIFSPFNGAINVSIVSSENGATIFSQNGVQLTGGYWNGSYLVGYSVPDGIYYLNISESSNNYSVYSDTLTFQALELSAYANQNYYLPGEPATIFYTVTNTSNNAPGVGVNVTYTLNYTTSNGDQSLSGIVSGGVLNIVIPSTAVIPSTVKVKLFAVDSYGHNATEVLYLEAAPLMGEVSTDQGSYFRGSPVIVQADALAGVATYATSPVAGAVVYVNVSFGGSVISSYSGSALATDGQGIASYAFMLSKNATLGTYTVSAKIRAYGWSNTTTYKFQVQKQPLSYSLELIPGQSSYMGGQQFSATWILVNNGSSVTPAFASYSAYIGSSTVAAGTNSNGKIQFQIPTGYNGDLYLYVDASDQQGNSASSYVYVSVNQAMLILNPSRLEYSPSSMVYFNYSISGSGFSSPQFYYSITDANGNTVSSGSTTAFSVQFRVPSTPSSYYTLSLTATNSSSGGVLTQSATIYELSGLELSFTISQSSFVDGAYSPGQTVTIYYRITALGNTPAPSSYDVYIWMPGYQSSYKMFTVSAQSGKLTYTIPGGLSQGGYQIYAYAQAASGSGSTPQVAQNLQISQVEPFWNYNVIGGISLGSVLMGVVTLIALALAVLAYSGRRIHGRQSKEGGAEKQPEQKGNGGSEAKQPEQQPEAKQDAGGEGGNPPSS